MMKHVDIWTDGACSGNPGPGGWAAILRYNGCEKTLAGGIGQTTSNRAELAAILKGLEALKEPCHVTIHTDSANAIGWLSQGWKRRVAEIRQACDLVDAAVESGGHEVEYTHVKGHSGDPLNEKADCLAREACPI